MLVKITLNVSIMCGELRHLSILFVNDRTKRFCPVDQSLFYSGYSPATRGLCSIFCSPCFKFIGCRDQVKNRRRSTEFKFQGKLISPLRDHILRYHLQCGLYFKVEVYISYFRQLGLLYFNIYAITFDIYEIGIIRLQL